VLCFFVVLCSGVTFLSVDKQQKIFTWNQAKVFLNGVNQAWIQYGNDFGNNQSNGEYCALRETLKNMTAVSGHAMRIWLFVEGDEIPQWDSNGYVIGTDGKNTLIDDMRHYLWTAQNQGVLVFWCLWNGAVLRNKNTINLFYDTSKLQSFIDKALVPIVKSLSNESAIGGWEIMNEPEGSVQISNDSNPCFRTSDVLTGSGAGWAGTNIPMKNILQFINWQADAIHNADPKALVTTGSWSERAMTDQFGYRNYYKDECLISAGGRQKGYFDFYQVHSYGFNGQFSSNSPFKKSFADYNLDKPLVVGEFDAQSVTGWTPQQLYQYVYEHGYAGAWGWTAEPQYGNFAGMAALKGKPYIDFNTGRSPTFPDTCDCSDITPTPQYTCAQQASWGKCGESWMKGYCCRSCNACKGCT